MAGCLHPFLPEDTRRGVEGLLGGGPWPVVVTRPVSAAGSGAGDGAGLHPRPGRGRYHRQEGPAHQTALPLRQRLHQGDLLRVPGRTAPLHRPLAFVPRRPCLAGVGAFSPWLLALLSSLQKSFQFPGEGGGRRRYGSLEGEVRLCLRPMWVQVPILRLCDRRLRVLTRIAVVRALGSSAVGAQSVPGGQWVLSKR